MQRLVMMVGLAGCEAATAPSSATAPSNPGVASNPVATVPSDPPSREIDARFVDTIRSAAVYREWGRVDDEPRVAPAPCAAPGMAVSSGPDHQVRRSAADHGPHGRKLYYLWATDRDRYVALGATGPIPVGFTIVKESFAAVTNATDPKIDTMVTDSGERLGVGARKDLFVMTKVGPKPGSDDDWIYGTIAVDGSVTSAGRVASCMGCHDKGAKHERLFGLAPSSKH